MALSRFMAALPHLLPGVVLPQLGDLERRLAVALVAAR
jgi:hypothetical protein